MAVGQSVEAEGASRWELNQAGQQAIKAALSPDGWLNGWRLSDESTQQAAGDTRRQAAAALLAMAGGAARLVARTKTERGWERGGDSNGGWIATVQEGGKDGAGLQNGPGLAREGRKVHGCVVLGRVNAAGRAWRY